MEKTEVWQGQMAPDPALDPIRDGEGYAHLQDEFGRPRCCDREGGR